MYYPVYALLYCVSLLPFWILYGISDLVYILLYHVIGYRRKLVEYNLSVAFPDKPAAERKKIEKAFYHNFLDNWIETLKLLSMSRASLEQHITGDLDIFHRLSAEGKTCQVLLGHLFNWELGNSLVAVNGRYTLIIAYSPITNKIVDRLMLHLRQRFGTIFVPYNDMRRSMLPYRNRQYALALVADQSPSNPAKSYWIDFLHRRTAFLPGPEKGARAGKLPVVFVGFSKPGRGRYHITASLLCEDASLTAPGELTRWYVSALEENIRRQPELYLWSHNRWKNSWREEFGDKLVLQK